jgi:peroxiredoxin
MPALTAGTKAPEFELHTLDGKLFSLAESLAKGPVVLTFFKVSCPTCQYALPFFQRLHQAYANHGVAVVGVSQNDPHATAAFVKEYGLTFPIVLDQQPAYPVSNDYGLTNVPTAFWIAQDGEIKLSSVGWLKADFQEINRKMAEAGRATPHSMFAPGEEVRDFRAG